MLQRCKNKENNTYSFHLEEGKTYSFCTCGLSKKQPLCDGSHRGNSDKKPLIIKAEKSESVDKTPFL